MPTCATCGVGFVETDDVIEGEVSFAEDGVFGSTLHFCSGPCYLEATDDRDFGDLLQEYEVAECIRVMNERPGR